MESFDEEVKHAMHEVAFGVKEVSFSKWNSDNTWKRPTISFLKIVTLEGQTYTVLASIQGYKVCDSHIGVPMRFYNLCVKAASITLL